jgi:hypothetical protein
LAALGQSIKFAVENYYVRRSLSKDAAPELIKQIARETTVPGPFGPMSAPMAPRQPLISSRQQTF